MKGCMKCSLYKSRTQVVRGKGNINANILFVGEAPGAKEDELGIPFVGEAGKILDKMLVYLELGYDDVFITNVVKCRPPFNRNPLQEEIKACSGFLAQEINLMHPKLIVALGRVAVSVFAKDLDCQPERGKLFKWENYSILYLYHPAALLYSPIKPKVDDTRRYLKKYKHFINKIKEH